MERCEGIHERVAHTLSNYVACLLEGLVPDIPADPKERSALIAFLISQILVECFLLSSVVEIPPGARPAALRPSAGTTGISLEAGQARVQIRGSEHPLDVAPVVRDGTFYAPLRLLAELYGATVRWQPQDGVAVVTMPLGGTLAVRDGADGISVNGRLLVPLSVLERLGIRGRLEGNRLHLEDGLAAVLEQSMAGLLQHLGGSGTPADAGAVLPQLLPRILTETFLLYLLWDPAEPGRAGGDLAVIPQVQGGVPFVPLRLVVEWFGGQTSWKPQEQVGTATMPWGSTQTVRPGANGLLHEGTLLARVSVLEQLGLEARDQGNALLLRRNP